MHISIFLYIFVWQNHIKLIIKLIKLKNNICKFVNEQLIKLSKYNE